MKDPSLPQKNYDGRQHRADGERSRQAILKAASELATIDGLDGLSIARLADYVGMSKSGLFAHFKSKEELQLATIDAASAKFDEDVLQSAMSAAPGLARIKAFCEGFFSHLERRVFPGGCFFVSVAAEFGGRSGPVRDYASDSYSRVLVKFTAIIRETQELGELDRREDVAQLAFELDSFMLCVNFALLFFRDPAAISRGREAIRQRLARATPVKAVGRKRRRAR